MKFIDYIKNIFVGIYNLMLGMGITMKNMIRPKVTEAYPENRLTKVKMERFRGELIMPHNENNEHRCTACKICEMSCSNGTIQISVKKEVDPETGKEKKVLDRYIYDLGSCIYCSLCTQACPQDAIDWSPEFEHAVFTAGKLKKQLNKEGSSLVKKEKKEPLNS
jgi:Formate hydrogenlyase subunit 6/NADH:ubiquinone oxidoreductase 23 kD subunit (chain I)